MRFEITQNPTDNSYTYEIINEAGAAIFASGSFSTREACTSHIESAVQSLGNPDRFVTQADGSLALVEADGTVLVRSQNLPAGQSPQNVINDLVDEARRFGEFQVTLLGTPAARRPSAASSLRTLSDEELANLYNFARQSTSGDTGFELFQSDEDKQHYFHFNDADGNAVLFSRGFSTAGQRDKRLESVIQSASRENRFEIKDIGGLFHFILKARNGQEIARSRPFATSNEASQAVSFVHESAPTYAEQYTKKRKKRDSSGSDNYLLDVPSPNNNPGFVSFKNPATGRHYFHLNDSNGNPVLYSQGYTSGRGRDNGIRSVIKNSINQGSFSPKDLPGEYLFTLVAGNRQEIARSKPFQTAATRDEMIEFLLKWIPQFAPDYSVSLDALRPTATETFTLANTPPPAADASDSDEQSAESTDQDTDGSTMAAIGAGAMLAGAGARDADAQQAEEDTDPSGSTQDADDSASTEESDFSGDTVILSGNRPSGGDGAPGEAPAPEPSAEIEEEKEKEEEGEYAYADEGGGWLRIPWWVIPLVLGLLLIFLLRGCLGCTDLPQSGLAGNEAGTQEEVVEADNTLSESAAGGVNMEGSGSSGDDDGMTAETAAGAAAADNNADDESDASSSSQTVLGPNALALGFAPGSLEARIADLLSTSDRTLPASFVMDKVAFPSHSAKLNKGAYGQVDNLVTLLKAYPDIVFEFVGHIDGTEDENSARGFMNGENITLSEVRARCLVKKFEEQSISSSQLSYSGLGATKPVADNGSETGKQENRRLELVVKTQ